MNGRTPHLKLIASALAVCVACVGPEFASAATAADGSAASAPAEAGQTTKSAPPPPLKEYARIVDRSDEVAAVLSNGMRVIIKRTATGPIVSVRLFVRTGSVCEGDLTGAGISHILEHLLHGGSTQNRSEEQSSLILEQIGAQSNAYTSYDHTCYYIDTTAGNLEVALDLLADWITRPAFRDSEFRRELGVVQRELERFADDPVRQLHQLTMIAAYLRHPAQFPIIGFPDCITGLTRQQVIDYWKKTYVPDNTVLVVCGQVDIAKTLETIGKVFADFRRRPAEPVLLPDEPPVVSPRLVLKRMPVKAAMVRFAWRTVPLTHPDLYALDLASFVLTEGPSSRLQRELIFQKKIASSVSGMSWTPTWGPGIFAITVRCAPEKLDAARSAVLAEIRALSQDPPSNEELAKAKRQKIAEYVQSSQTIQQIAANMAIDFMATGDPHFSRRYVDEIQLVEPEQIRQVVRRYLKPDRLITVVIAPPEAALPDWARTSQARQTAGPSEIRKIVLPNGLRVLLQRDDRVPSVAIQLYCLGGLLAETAETNGICNLMAKAALRGTRKFTGDEIAEFFDSVGGAIDAGAGNNTIYFRSEVLSEHFAKALEVFAEVVTHPTFTPEAVEQVRAPVIDAIRRRKENWRSELIRYLRAKYFSNHPYAMDPLGSEQVVSKLSPQQIADFYQHYVVGPSCVLAIFGDIDLTEAERQVRELFADLPAGPPPQLAPLVSPEPRGKVIFVRQPESDERRVAGIGLAYPSVPYTAVKHRFALTLLDTIISGYYLPGGWLHEALRGGQRDLAYEVHAINFTGLRGGMFEVYAGCRPEQASQVISIILEELQKAQNGRFSQAELVRARNIVLTADLLDKQSNAERAMQAALDELYGLGFNFSEVLPEALAKIGLNDVRDAARRFLQQPVIVVITPKPQMLRLSGWKVVLEGKSQLSAQGVQKTAGSTQQNRE